MKNYASDERKKDMDWTERMFWLHVEPVLKTECNLPGTFYSIEGHLKDNNELQQVLDFAGIDYMYAENGLVKGLAMRIQKGKCWDTFTIRKSRYSGTETEFEKRKFAIENYGIYPYFTVQAYIEDDKLSGLAICKTKDLWDMILKNRCYTVKCSDNASFYIVKWSDMERLDKYIRVFTGGVNNAV